MSGIAVIAEENNGRQIINYFDQKRGSVIEAAGLGYRKPGGRPLHFVVTLLIATRFIRGSIVAPFQKKTIASFVYGCFSRNLLIDEKRFEFHPNWKNVPLSSRVTGSVCWMKKGKKGEEKKRSRTIFVFFSSTFFPVVYKKNWISQRSSSQPIIIR